MVHPLPVKEIELRQAFQETYSKFSWEWMVTTRTYKQTSFETASKKLDRYLSRLEKIVNFHIVAIGNIVMDITGVHAHVLAASYETAKTLHAVSETRQLRCKTAWSELTERSCDIVPVHDLKGVTRYLSQPRNLDIATGDFSTPYHFGKERLRRFLKRNSKHLLSGDPYL